MSKRRYGKPDPLVDIFRQLRQKKGLTQWKVARRMNTKQSAVSNLESGKIRPHLETFRRYMAAVMDLPSIIINDEEPEVANDGGMPEFPFTELQEHAIKIHELYSVFVAAGFTPGQAMEFVLDMWRRALTTTVVTPPEEA